MRVYIQCVCMRMYIMCVCDPPSMVYTGGDSQDLEDEEENGKRGSADRAGRDPKEHVYSTKEDDQRAD